MTSEPALRRACGSLPRYAHGSHAIAPGRRRPRLVVAVVAYLERIGKRVARTLSSHRGGGEMRKRSCRCSAVLREHGTAGPFYLSDCRAIVIEPSPRGRNRGPGVGCSDAGYAASSLDKWKSDPGRLAGDPVRLYTRVVHTAETGFLQRPCFIGFLSLLRQLAERESVNPH
jgi:hypothetical protein